MKRTGKPTPRRGFHWIGIRKGWLPGRPERLLGALVTFPPSDAETHTLIIGATGSGKTNLLHHLIAQCILLGLSFIVLDLRGDLVSAVLELLAGRVNPSSIALFDLREREQPLGFNPLLGAGEPYFKALGVLDAISAEAESWGVQLAETLRNALLLLAEFGEPLTCIESLFYDDVYRDQLVAKCSDLHVRTFWLQYGELSKEKRAALASPVRNKVSLLYCTTSLRRTLGNAAPINLGKHLNTPGSVTLASLAADETHGAGRTFGNLLLSSICREIFSRVNDAESTRNRILLIVDEFENFNTQEFEHILVEGRRFGLSLVLAHQTLAQLSPRMRSLILGNVGAKFVFRTGRDDQATLSKDLTGDAKSLDFCTLPVGEAILWRRSKEIVHFEVNRPIVKSVGRSSPAAKQLLEEIKACRPKVTADQGQQTQPDSPITKPTPPQSKRTPKLEEWL